LVSVALNESPINASVLEIKGEEKLVEHDYLDFSYIGYILQIAIGGLFAKIWNLCGA